MLNRLPTLELAPNLLTTLLINTHSPVQEAAFLDRASGKPHLVALGRLQRKPVIGASVCAVGVYGGEVRDRVWRGVFDADAGHAGV